VFGKDGDGRLQIIDGFQETFFSALNFCELYLEDRGGLNQGLLVLGPLAMLGKDGDGRLQCIDGSQETFS
jgi:hypothetical protein